MIETNLRGITRIDSKNTHGWYVKISYEGKIVSTKLFSDIKLGGKDVALAKAVKFRDRIFLKKLRLEKVPDRYRSSLTPKPKGGAKGVFLTKQKSIPYWSAFAPAGNDVHKHAYFSIDKYGFNRAKALAEKQRGIWLADIKAKRPLSKRQDSTPAQYFDAADELLKAAENLLVNALDLDKCIEEETGKMHTDWAALSEAIDKLKKV